MTVAEVAALTTTSPQNIRSLIGRGKLPARKLGRDWYIDPADAARYVQEHGKKARTPR